MHKMNLRNQGRSKEERRKRGWERENGRRNEGMKEERGKEGREGGGRGKEGKGGERGKNKFKFPGLFPLINSWKILM